MSAKTMIANAFATDFAAGTQAEPVRPTARQLYLRLGRTGSVNGPCVNAR